MASFEMTESSKAGDFPEHNQGTVDDVERFPSYRDEELELIRIERVYK